MIRQCHTVQRIRRFAAAAEQQRRGKIAVFPFVQIFLCLVGPVFDVGAKALGVFFETVDPAGGRRFIAGESGMFEVDHQIARPGIELRDQRVGAGVVEPEGIFLAVPGVNIGAVFQQQKIMRDSTFFLIIHR